MKTEATAKGGDRTRDQLLEAATFLFAKQGFSGTSVKKIAERAKANISLVSYHFGGKEGIYRECLLPYIESKLEFLKTKMQTPATLSEFKLCMKIFLEAMIDEEIRNLDTGCIIRREIETDDPIAMEIFKKSIQKLFETFVGFIKQAQDANFIRNDLPPRTVSVFLMGGVQYALRTDKLRKKLYSESIVDPQIRDEFINTTLEIFFHGMEPR